jgi:hypothetical protein
MALLPFLLMDNLQAARFREETAGDQNRLEPRLIEGGVHKNKYAIPRRVLDDPAYSDRQDALLMLNEVALETEVAWPPQVEED